MKVLFMVYSLTGGGAERVAVNLMNRLSLDNEVTACLFQERNPAVEYPLSDRVRVVVLPEYKRLDKKTRYKRLAVDLLALKRRGNYDVAISFLELGNFLNAITRSVFGPKTIISIRNLAYRKIELLSQFDERVKLMRIQGRCAHRVVCVSEDVAYEQMEKFGVPARKICVVNNWIDAGTVRASASEALDDPAFEAFADAHPFLFANVGRLNIQKGQWHLIRAFGKLHRDHPEAGLLILGEGNSDTDLRGKLEQTIRDNGLDDCVYLAGRKTNPFPYLKRSQVFVLSSLFEGFSNAVLEAMAVGLPVIADDCAGVRECLTPGRKREDAAREVLYGEYGIVTPLLSSEWPETAQLDKEEAYLYDAMKQLFEQLSLREAYSVMSQACLERYKPEVIMKQWLEVIG